MQLQTFSDHNLTKLQSEQLQGSRVNKKVWVDILCAAELNCAASCVLYLTLC